jgi:hypothetical protein
MSTRKVRTIVVRGVLRFEEPQDFDKVLGQHLPTDTLLRRQFPEWEWTTMWMDDMGPNLKLLNDTSQFELYEELRRKFEPLQKAS